MPWYSENGQQHEITRHEWAANDPSTNYVAEPSGVWEESSASTRRHLACGAVGREILRLAERVRELEAQTPECGETLPLCESCGKPADGRTADDVPLCSACGKGLELEARIATLEEENARLRAVQTQLLACAKAADPNSPLRQEILFLLPLANGNAEPVPYRPGGELDEP